MGADGWRDRLVDASGAAGGCWTLSEARIVSVRCYFIAKLLSDIKDTANITNAPLVTNCDGMPITCFQNLTGTKEVPRSRWVSFFRLLDRSHDTERTMEGVRKDTL